MLVTMTSLRLLVLPICTAFVLGTLVFIGVRAYDGNVSALLHMDTEFGERIGVPSGVVLYEDGGYDGMAYYQIARDIPALFGVSSLSFDSAYRFQRILVPLIVFLVTFGYEAWFSWAFLFLNIAAALGSLILALHMSKKTSVHALTAVFNPAMLVGILYSLTEPVSLFFLMAFFWRWQKNDRLDVMAVLVLLLSVLARETTVFLLFFLFVWLCLQKRWREALYSTLPVVAFFVWQWFLSWRFGQIGVETGGHMFNLPFSGIITLLVWAWSETGMHQVYRFTSLALLAFIIPVIALVTRDWFTQRGRMQMDTFVLTGLLAVMFSMDAHIWGVITSIGRVITPVYPAYIVYAMRKDTPTLRVLSGLLIVVSLVSAFGIAAVKHPFIVS